MEDIEKQDSLDIQKYSSLEEALRNYLELPSDKKKALGAMNTTPLPAVWIWFIVRWSGHNHSGLRKGGRLAEP